MAFEINHIKATNIDLTDDLKNKVAEKLSTLEKHTTYYNDVSCDVELERKNGQANGDIYRAEANVHMGGKLYRAVATTDQLEKSIDEIKDELNDELRKAREKSHTLLKRGGAAIKRMMRFGN